MMLTFHSPAPHRMALVLTLTALGLLASSLSQAPSIGRMAASWMHSTICKCAHCPGGAACCCHSLLHSSSCPSVAGQ